jgi:ClpP class serine protease
METMCGGFDLAVFSEQMVDLADDPTVRAVVIDLNTPGGVAIGVGQAAESIRRVAESGKRVIGYADYQCASAGYWLASACDEFHAEESAMVGSISTFSAGVDSSRMWEMEGLELKLFRTGELKAIGHPGKAWTPEEEEFMRTKTEAVDAMFKGFVAARRGLTAAEMNGGFWAAGCAPAGVVDSTVFGTLRELVESLI